MITEIRRSIEVSLNRRRLTAQTITGRHQGAGTQAGAGGYRPARPSGEVPLGDVMDVIEGSISAVREPSASAESPAVKVLTRAWRDVADEVGEMLGTITFAELVKRVDEEDR